MRLAPGAGKQQGEGAACALAAFHGDGAAQQSSEVARNRQAKAGTAIAPAGRAIGLAESIKNNLLLILANTDARVLHGKSNVVSGPLGHGETDLARFSEFDRVGEQVFQDLLDPLAVGEKRGRCALLDRDVERQFLLVGHRFKSAFE